MGFTIVSFGEVLWDLLPGGPVLGGAPFNFAYRSAALGNRSLMVSRLGRDERGRVAFSRAVELGMDTSFLQWDDEHPTGTVEVTLDSTGNPEYRILPDVAYDYIELTPDLLACLSTVDCLCFGTLAQRCEGSRRALAGLRAAFQGRFSLLDLNLRKDCWTPYSVRSSVEAASVLKLNDQELAVVAGIFDLPELPLPRLAENLLSACSLEYVVVTLGAGGSFALRQGGENVYAPAYSVQPVDTVGAGDAFTAGFIHGLLSGMPLAQTVRYGNALGALVTGQRGATQRIADNQIQALLSGAATLPVDPRFM